MPVVLPALADLSVLIFFVGCLLFCILCVLIVKALFGTASSAVSWIPWVGSAASSGLHKAEHHVVAIFSAGANKSQSYIGATWHMSARLVDWLGREINSHANMLWLLANQIPGVGMVHFLVTEIAAAKRSVDTLLHRITHLHTAVVTPISGELKALERWTYPRVKGLEREIEHTIPKDIAGLRTRTKTIEGELSRLWDAVRANEKALATTAFVGAVALALSRLGLGWLRCNSATQIAKKHGCSLWSKLEQLLPLGAFLVIAFDFPDFCKAARMVAIGIGDSVAAIEGAFDPQLEPLPPPKG